MARLTGNRINLKFQTIIKNSLIIQVWVSLTFTALSSRPCLYCGRVVQYARRLWCDVVVDILILFCSTCLPTTFNSKVYQSFSKTANTLLIVQPVCLLCSKVFKLATFTTLELLFDNNACNKLMLLPVIPFIYREKY